MRCLALIIFSLAIMAPMEAQPPSGGDFTITRSTIDGGGREASGPGYSLAGTVGQPDAARMTGTDFCAERRLLEAA